MTAGAGGHLLRNDVLGRPRRAVSATGVWITDDAGQRYLDGCSGAVVCGIGHGHPHVVAAIARQAAQLTFAHRSAFGTEVLEQLADRLCAFTGYAGAWFVGSGSEAVEAALQLAIHFHRERGASARTRFLSFRRSYHGNTLGGLSLSGNARREALGPLLHDFPCLPEPYAFRQQGDRSEQDWVADMLAAARPLFEAHAAELAGVVVEPVGGATMGATVAPAAYLRGLRELCDEFGALLIADEVMTGMGRCGTPMALEQFGVAADIATLGKGLGAGYAPIAAALVSRDVREAFLAGGGRIPGGHTYAGNPLSAATALAVLDVLEGEDVLRHSATVARRLAAGLATLGRDRRQVIDVRGLGMLQAVEVVPDAAQGRAARRVAERALQHGLVLYPTTGGVNDALLVAPPLTSTPAEIDVLLERLGASVD